MGKKSNTKEFIEKAKLLYGDKIDYAKVEYINNSTKICLICKEHGEYWQIPKNHLRWCGCKKCVNKYKPTINEWIEKVNKIHNNFFSYEKSKYINCDTKLIITCPIHGDFEQTPFNHLKGCSCPKCKKCYNYTTIEWIEKAKKVHNSYFNYDKTSYKNYETELTITCPIHGDFEQLPFVHISGHGCPKCNSSELEKSVLNSLINNFLSFDYQKHFDWLGRQSLDFYLPQHNVAIECQGEQHFKPIEFFGGEKTFKVNQKRDINKKILCEKHGVKLIYYSDLKEYDTFLGENLIKNTEELIKMIK